LTEKKMHAPSNASAPGVRLRNRSDTYADITEFLFDEAELLDGLRFDAWAALLAPDLSYRVPLRVTRSTADQARSVDRVMMHFDDDHASIMGRIGRLGTRSAWAEDPPSRTRRLVTNVRVETTANDDEFAVRSYLLLTRSRSEQAHLFLLSAERHDILRQTDEGFRLARREVILDQSVLGMPNLAVFL